MNEKPRNFRGGNPPGNRNGQNNQNNPNSPSGQNPQNGQNNQNSQNRSSQGKGRGNRHNQRRQKQRPEVPTIQGVVWVPMDCELCGKTIEEMGSAIAWGSEGHAAHMECVIIELGKKETLRSEEKVIYIGSGNFAVVKEGEGTFEILRKIPVESKDKVPEWRRDIKNQISKSP